jgi:hypothetical protein
MMSGSEWKGEKQWAGKKGQQYVYDYSNIISNQQQDKIMKRSDQRAGHTGSEGT